MNDPEVFLTKRAQGIQPSTTLAVDVRAKALTAAGKDVVNFGVGEPDFPTTPAATAAAIEAIKEGFTKYTPSAGIPALRQAICDTFLKDNGLEYRPDQIVVSNGAKHSLYNAFQVLCEEGDEVLIPSPYWVTYPEQVRLCGGVPVFVETDEASGYKLDVLALEAKVTPRTRILCLNSPCNPTGAVLPPKTVEAIADFVLRHGLYLITDEVYQKLVYHGVRHLSPAAVSDEVKRRSVVINGVSKAYAMTGWRIGFAAAEGPIAKAMAELQGHMTTGTGSVAQRAALAALRDDAEAVAKMVEEFEKRRDYTVKRLKAMPGFSTPDPQGAFYVFPTIGKLFGRTVGGKVIRSGDDLAMALLESANVAVVPGAGFGRPDAIRFSYATSMENIARGLDRVEEAVRSAS